MQEKIEEARREFNAILDYILRGAMGLEIHKVEDGIYRKLLRLGRILLELFVLATGTGNIGKALTGEDGTSKVLTELRSDAKGSSQGAA